MPDTLTVSGAGYAVIRLLGKGKGGYSYLVTDGTVQYVLKQIHHEPREYYTFGDKLRSELRDYETLRKVGIPMPRLLAVDVPQGGTLYRIGYECSAIWSSGTSSTGARSIGQRRHRKEIRYKNRPKAAGEFTCGLRHKRGKDESKFNSARWRLPPPPGPWRRCG